MDGGFGVVAVPRLCSECKSYSDQKSRNFTSNDIDKVF